MNETVINSHPGLSYEDDLEDTSINRNSIYYLWRPYLKDPFYDHVLELALASQSRYIPQS